MKRSHRLAAWVLALASGSSLVTTAEARPPAGSSFTYQGEVKNASVPLNASADFEFRLFDAVSGGSQVGPTLNASSVNVVNGRFAVQLDFGFSAFTGDARWIEISVRSPSGSGAFST
ncbi:MAG: hypothetical protein J0L61_06845, partial [Planctomycetes bacterium]|nr:hypothetical protein [Planctomycetota bacterium]